MPKKEITNPLKPIYSDEKPVKIPEKVDLMLELQYFRADGVTFREGEIRRGWSSGWMKIGDMQRQRNEHLERATEIDELIRIHSRLTFNQITV